MRGRIDEEGLSGLAQEKRTSPELDGSYTRKMKTIRADTDNTS